MHVRASAGSNDVWVYSHVMCVCVSVCVCVCVYVHVITSYV